LSENFATSFEELIVEQLENEENERQDGFELRINVLRKLLNTI